MGRAGPPSNTWFLGPTRVKNPNDISMGSAVFAGAQPRFQSWGPIPWSRLLYRTKYGWCTQFRALQYVTYITVITLFIKKVGVVHPNFGGPDPLHPQWLRPWVFAALTIVTDHAIDREFVTSAKTFANFNEFSEIKKIRKNS